VSDDDPGRDRYGILRTCERVLRKRGISVYPCLIRSMQNLTSRGMRLAAALRVEGVPVIESYPGAAQDIMRIPRKRASLELLRDGLREFGIGGDWLDMQVSHDELDAITAAIVGLFFWSGRFEGIGSASEGTLIVPDLRNAPVWQDRVIVGLSGPIAVGKTTAAQYLKSRGLHYTRFSLILAYILDERGIAATRETLQQLGDEIYSSSRQRSLCERLVGSLPENGHAVIDGLRHLEDHAFLVERFGPSFVHVHLSAEREIRMGRYGAPDEFRRAEEHRVERNVPRLDAVAHLKLTNNEDINAFARRIRDTLQNRLILP
jgi:predicted nuclease with RNAse H fold/dephospho-CoA kinase